MHDATDFRNYVIPKPWGHEYIIFENNFLSIWYLFIKSGASTSLHCHPKKKTGLVVLEGTARFHLIERDFELQSNQKVMIRPGSFHKTENRTNQNLHIIEVETPKDKENLVRISDLYGRQNKAYESETLKRTNEFFIPNDSFLKLEFLNNSFEIVSNLITLNPNDSDLLVVLSPTLFKHHDHDLCPVGEILSGKTFKKLAIDYTIAKNAQILKICHL